MLGTNIKTDTNVKLPVSFIVFGLIAFAASQAILFVGSNEILAGLFRIPKIWMSAHFLLLGFAVMTAMGAMYQLVPVAFLTPIWNEKFGFFQFFITAIGITSFALLLGFKTNFAIFGGILTVIGILLFIFQMAKTLSTTDKLGGMSKFVICALACLFLTITAGLLLTWNFAFGEYIDHLPLLMTHITLGAGGWFTLLIFGFSYKLVPMFSLSHGFENNWEKWAFYAYGTGLLITILSYWVDIQNVRIFGFFLLLAGFGFFALDMKEILAKRVRKKLDQPFSFSLFAIINGLILHSAAFFVSLLGIYTPALWSWIIFLYIMTWILFSILGYLYKIVPFLWWTHKYSEKAGKEKVPTLREMMNEKLGLVLYIFFYINVFGIMISAALQFGPALFFFLGLQAVTAAVYALSIIRVFLK